MRSVAQRNADQHDGKHWRGRFGDKGHVASDHHTTEVPPEERNRRFATNAAEMGVPKHELQTTRTRRAEQCDWPSLSTCGMRQHLQVDRMWAAEIKLMLEWSTASHFTS